MIRARAANRLMRGSFALLSRRIVDPFHRLFYNASLATWSDTRWLSVPVSKCPFDLWVYQEILSELRPAVIVESGTSFGGSALFLASVCDSLGQGEVITIDISETGTAYAIERGEVVAIDLGQESRPTHRRIAYLTGSSISDEIVDEVRRRIGGRAPVLVVLDSDHSKTHVLAELRRYAPLVSPGSYLIVEDTNLNGHPVLPRFGPGPSEAIAEFLNETDDFFVDRTREKYFLTFNPGGYLCKRAEARG